MKKMQTLLRTPNRFVFGVVDMFQEQQEGKLFKQSFGDLAAKNDKGWVVESVLPGLGLWYACL